MKLSTGAAFYAGSVGRSTLEIMTLLQIYWEHARSGIDGSWGDDRFRVAGFVHQLVGISLFPELWDAWAYSGIKQALDSQDPNSDFSADGHPHAILWPAGRPVGWDENPQAYAEQIADLVVRLRSVIVAGTAVDGLVLPGPPGLWDPQNASPPGLTQEQMNARNNLSNIVKETLASYGLSDLYDTPIWGLGLQIVQAIIDIFVWIFGEASGVQTIFDTPLVPGELEQWLLYSSAVTMLLDRLLSECRKSTGGPLRMTGGEQVFTGKHAELRPSKTSTAAVVVVGTGVALLLVWAALA